jgi:hypothetical protein
MISYDGDDDESGGDDDESDNDMIMRVMVIRFRCDSNTRTCTREAKESL